MKLARREWAELTFLSVGMLLLLGLYIYITLSYEHASAGMISNVSGAYERFNKLSMPREWMFQLCRDSWIVLALITVAKSASGKIHVGTGYYFLVFNMLLGWALLMLFWVTLKNPKSILQMTVIWGAAKSCVLYSIPLIWNCGCHVVCVLLSRLKKNTDK